jgi:hypothetical protein
MAAGEQLLTNVKHDDVWYDAGEPVPADLPDDVVEELREQGAVGYPEQTPEQVEASMTDIDAKLQDRFGVSLADLMESGEEPAEPDEE